MLVMRPFPMFRQPADNPFEPIYGMNPMMGNVPFPVGPTMQPNYSTYNPEEMYPQYPVPPVSAPYPMYGHGNFEGGGFYGNELIHNHMPSQQNPYPYPPMPSNKMYPPMQIGGGQSPFANPLQAKKVMQQPPGPSPNPYPKQQFMQKAQPSGFQSIMNQFKTQDGSMDITKMMNTAGQMMGTVSQMQGMFKGLTGLFKLPT